MTTQRNSGDAPRNKAQAATVREAKGSVHEAIGKLIGDDTARKRGTAEKQAGAREADDIDRPNSPSPTTFLSFQQE